MKVMAEICRLCIISRLHRISRPQKSALSDCANNSCLSFSFLCYDKLGHGVLVLVLGVVDFHFGFGIFESSLGVGSSTWHWAQAFMLGLGVFGQLMRLPSYIWSFWTGSSLRTLWSLWDFAVHNFITLGALISVSLIELINCWRTLNLIYGIEAYITISQLNVPSACLEIAHPLSFGPPHNMRFNDRVAFSYETLC